MTQSNLKKITAIFSVCAVAFLSMSALGHEIDRTDLEDTDALNVDAPKGVIFLFDPVVRKNDGTPTGKYYRVPRGWQECDGTNRTPDLRGRFVKGAEAIPHAGEYGGRVDIPTDGGHTHGRGAEVDRNFGDDHSDNNFRTDANGGHNHGGNNQPPYYTLMMICKR